MKNGYDLLLSPSYPLFKLMWPLLSADALIDQSVLQELIDRESCTI